MVDLFVKMHRIFLDCFLPDVGTVPTLENESVRLHTTRPRMKIPGAFERQNLDVSDDVWRSEQQNNRGGTGAICLWVTRPLEIQDVSLL